MSKICIHEFEQRDSENPDYSQTEYDLYAKLDMSIRKNHVIGNFEISRISSGKKVYEGSLEQMVAIANNLEGEENTEIGCDNLICKNKRK